MLAGRSPSEDEKAYVAAVASRKNLGHVGVSSGDVLGATWGMEGDLQGEEGKDVSPDASGVDRSVDAEGLEGSQDDEDGRPAVVEREREVDEDLVRSALGLVVLLDDVVDVLRAQFQPFCSRKGTMRVSNVPSLRS